MTMTDTRTQKNRAMAITTPLGTDKLVLLAMYGSESLGRLFQFELDLAAETSSIDFTKILGKSVTIRLEMVDNQVRHFNGFISKFTFTGVDEPRQGKKVYYYRATLVPWLWFLTRHADCRIFQQMTVVEIIEKVFRDRSFSDFDSKGLSGTYRKWEYCVQYRETDFNFVSRLMENEGIYYYFKHEDGKHTLVLCDASTAHKTVSGYEKLLFDKPDLKTPHDAFIWDWSSGHEITPNQYALTDYNPLQPQAMQEKVVSLDHTHDSSTYEIFDYPGGYSEPSDGRTYTNVRMEEIEVGYALATGVTSARGIFAGANFALQGHPAFDEDSYLITSMTYQLRNEDTGLSPAQAGRRGPTYRAQLTCIPAKREYRTPRLTPKPVVQGPQTAVIVGPSGEEIYTDKYARVKVQFFWDREGKKNENSSCWVRVSQNWAGKQWGIIFNPRIGQEVVVEFLEGDPDRPLITGRVYNADQMPPYTLPANQTQSGIKTRSSKGGGPANFNEIRFEDKKGEEQLFIHAEKNQDIEVENDETHWVGHDRTKTIDHDETTHVKHDRTETVDNNETITIGGNRTETVEKDESISINGNRSETVEKDESIAINGNRTETVAKDESVTISKNRTTTISEKETLSVSKDRAASISGNDSLSVGKNLSVTAADQIVLQTGDASITMKKDGTITIKGKDITIQGSGKITCKASSDVILKGASIKEN